MVLPFAFPRLSGSPDACSGLNAWLSTRPPIQPFVQAYAGTIFGFFIVFSWICLGIWAMNRNEPRLKSRGLLMTCFAYVIIVMGFCVSFLRRSILTPQGHPTMPCRVHAFLWISLGPLQAGVGLLRLIKLLNQARYARLGRNIRGVLVGIGEDDLGESRSVVSHQSTRIASSVKVVEDRKNDFMAANRAILILFASMGYGTLARQMSRQKREVMPAAAGESPPPQQQQQQQYQTPSINMKDVEKGAAALGSAASSPPGTPRSVGTNLGGAKAKAAAQFLQDEKVLMLTKEALSPWSAIMILIIVYSPVVLALIIIFSVLDVYSGDCVSCDFYVETLICTAVPYAILLPPRLRVAYLLEEEPDPDGIIPELKFGTIVVLPGIILGTIFAAVDPGLADYNQYVAYEYFFIFGLFCAFCASVTHQIRLAFEERRERRMRMSKRYRPDKNAKSEWRMVGDRLMRRGKSNGTATTAASSTVGSSAAGAGGYYLKFTTPTMNAALKGDGELFDRFEAFAERQFCSESVKFLSDAWAWRRESKSKSKKWKRLKGQAMVRLYIRENAALQVNIPAEMRVPLEKIQTLTEEGYDDDPNAGADIIDEHFFDEAVEEVERLLCVNLWMKFVMAEEDERGTDFEPFVAAAANAAAS